MRYTAIPIFRVCINAAFVFRNEPHCEFAFNAVIPVRWFFGAGCHRQNPSIGIHILAQICEVRYKASDTVLEITFGAFQNGNILGLGDGVWFWSAPLASRVWHRIYRLRCRWQKVCLYWKKLPPGKDHWKELGSRGGRISEIELYKGHSLFGWRQKNDDWCQGDGIFECRWSAWALVVLDPHSGHLWNVG